MARQVRSELLAKRRGHEDNLDSIPSYDELEREIDKGKREDDEYLQSEGIDPDVLEQKAEQVVEQDRPQSRQSQKEVILEIVEGDEVLTQGDIVEAAREHGVSEEKTTKLLTRLRQKGRVVRKDEGFRAI